LYFGKIFPLGVEGLLEAADLVLAGKAEAIAQHEAEATYEGIVGKAESRINWASHVQQIYDLIRGCNPVPGAWTIHEGRRLFLFECEKRVARTYGEVRGKKIGQIVAAGEGRLTVHGRGGFIVVRRLRFDGGEKIAADQAGLDVGTILG
jgi:methionyl-tRNA formyltransferase